MPSFSEPVFNRADSRPRMDVLVNGVIEKRLFTVTMTAQFGMRQAPELRGDERVFWNVGGVVPIIMRTK